MAIVVKPEDQSAPLSVIGTRITVLAEQEEAGGREITLQSGDEGMGPPPHSHDWDESFYVLSGDVIFSCDGETTLCPAGTLVHVPGGTVHAFAYGEGGGQMLEITQSGQAAELFRKLDEEVPPGPPDL